MKTQNLELLPRTVYGTPSGNYDGSSTEFSGNRQKAVGYYRKPSGVQSVLFNIDDFIGDIVIQATLDADPDQDSNWFDVYTFPDDSSRTSANSSVALTGNFTWIRAHVTGFTGGTINSISVTY